MKPENERARKPPRFSWEIGVPCWTGELPQGRFLAVVQAINWKGQFSDVLHNPIIARRIVRREKADLAIEHAQAVIDGLKLIWRSARPSEKSPNRFD